MRPHVGFSLFLSVLCSFTLIACGGSGGGDGDDGGVIPINASYVVFAWNDLGMHCLNPTYDQAVILPPYNTVRAQVVMRGAPPLVVTSGLRVEYRILGNTFSYGKRAYSLFWDNSFVVFGTTVAHDKGLNLLFPDQHNGLSGSMRDEGNYFQVEGIPVTPVNDAGAWNPFQVAEITVKNASTDSVLAVTRCTVPTSDEIHCDKCHGTAGDVTSAFSDLIARHDNDPLIAGTLATPVLCANGSVDCHFSPALGQIPAGGGTNYLSKSLHGFHSRLASPPACYDCHPGATTSCNRSLAHTAPDGNCTHCHGTLSQVASSIASGSRVPWAQEPDCATCHNTGGTVIPQVDTGSSLYRNAEGHGALGCPACHQSPHAMVPSRETSDNYQALQYQGAEKSIASCGACHDQSHGEGSGEFLGTHGGTSPGEHSACSVCHTDFLDGGTISKWPHGFLWKAR